MTALDMISSASLPSVSAGAATNQALGIVGALASSTESARQIPWRQAGTFSKLRLRLNSNSLSAGGTFNFRIGGADGNQSVTIPASTTGEFIDSSNTDAVSAGDLVNGRLLAAAGTGSAAIAVAGVNFEGDSSVDYVTYGAGMASTYSTASTTVYLPIAGLGATMTTTEANQKTAFRCNGTLKNGYANVQTNGRGTNSTLRSRVNGANGNIVVTITASTTGVFEDTTNTDSVSSGDDINFSLTTGTGGGSIQGFFGAGFEVGSDLMYPLSAGSPAGSSFPTTAERVSAGGGFSLNPSTTLRNIAIETDCVAKRMYAYVSTNTALSNSTAYLWKNAANGNSFVTITGVTTGYFEDTTNTDTLSASDTIAYSVGRGSAGTLTLTHLGVHLDYTPAPLGQPTAKRQITVPFLGGSLRQGIF
jgi:hypothetical protein